MAGHRVLEDKYDSPAVLREYLDALDAGRFNYRPGWNCGTCDFRGEHCRAWQN